MYFFSYDTFRRKGARGMTVNAHESRARRGSPPAVGNIPLRNIFRSIITTSLLQAGPHLLMLPEGKDKEKLNANLGLMFGGR
jgi:hypothetical protein